MLTDDVPVQTTHMAGMEITASHRPKSIHISRLAIQFTPQSVIMAGQEMCTEQIIF